MLASRSQYHGSTRFIECWGSTSHEGSRCLKGGMAARAGGMTLELLLHVIVVKEQHPSINRSIANINDGFRVVGAL